MDKLRIALPLGHLKGATLGLFEEADYPVRLTGPRDYRAWTEVPDLKIKMFRSQEIPAVVAEVAEQNYDMGITGKDRILDWVYEHGFNGLSETNLVEISDLEYGKVRMVLAVPEKLQDIKSFNDLIKMFPKKCRIVTEYPYIAAKYVFEHTGQKPKMFVPSYEFTDTDSPIEIRYSWGGTEAKPPEDAEAIIENVETETTLGANRLKEIDIVLPYSSARLVVNRASLKNVTTRPLIKDVEIALNGVTKARKNYHIFFNLPNNSLTSTVKKLPAIRQPTITPMEGGWVRIDTIVPVKNYRRIRNALVKSGATGIVKYRPREIIDINPEDVADLNSNHDL